MSEYAGSGAQEPVLWFKQTIGNACGLIGLLHSISNGGAAEFILPGSHLDKLLKDATPLEPTARADLLYNSGVLESAHRAAAQLGDSKTPRPEEPVDLHYICFVKAADGHLWELNGGMKGPVDRGVLEPNEDALSERALQLGLKSLLNLKTKSIKDLRFRIVVLALNVN